MPSELEAEAAPLLKEWFDEQRYRGLAGLLGRASAVFDEGRFLEMTLVGLEQRSLMQRMRQTSLAVGVALPLDYADQLEVLRVVAPAVGHDFVGIFLADFVAQHGLERADLSLPALKFFTRYGSAEFAVRPFIARDPEATLAVMQEWSRDEDEHVRRLASEGSRPRLPWGQRLQRLIDEPGLSAGILRNLRCDESLYVRKSVANHLNDVSKDHADYVLETLAGWRALEHPFSAWIAKRACRSLIKSGYAPALNFFGFGGVPEVMAKLIVSPESLTLGSAVFLQAEVESLAGAPQKLAVDYRVHYVKANGATSPKVFKWTELELAPSERVCLKKKQSIKPFTTRQHYPGVHRVELQINGQICAEGAFDLVC